MKRIPAVIKVTPNEYDIITKDYGENPCHSCACLNSAECWGCNKRPEWYAQFETLPEELRELVKEYNQTHAIDNKINALKQEISDLKRKKEEILKSLNITIE